MRWLASILFALGAAAQEHTAATLTESWRGLDRVCDLVLPPDAAYEKTERTLLILLDPTPSLQKAQLPEAFARAFAKHAAKLALTKIGVVTIGTDKPVLAPTEDRQAVLAALRQALAAPQDRIQNVYAPLREAASSLRGRQGSKEILLATLDNGDAEDELEATTALLDAANIRVHVLATEAYVADSYWAIRQYEKAPRGTKLVGGDAPFIDMPWGWLFQITVANEVTPSGYAAYGLNRLAKASGGRVYLFAADAGAHRCSIYGGCLFCSGDHAPENEIYWSNRLQPLAPSTKARGAAAAELGADPCFRATTAAWRAARDAGLLHSQPPRLASTVSGGSGYAGDRSGLLFSLNFAKSAERADDMAKDCDRILGTLEAELARIEPGKALPRQRAIAEFTRVMLQVTKVNLVTFAGWCREIAPVWLAKDPPAPAPPERAPIDHPQRAVGFGYSNYCLCHGPRPFLEVELPGGAALREELGKLDAMVTRFAATYDQTPYIVALHRQGLARFHLTYPGVLAERPRERPNSKSAPDPTPLTGGARPARGGTTGTGGGAAGPTTGGK